MQIIPIGEINKMDRGWIKLWRKILDNGLMQDHKTFSLWIWILLNVTHKKIKYRAYGKEIELLPGQRVISYRPLAEELNMGVRSIRTSLKNLVKYGNLTLKSTHQYTILTVVNWDVYNSENPNPTHKVTHARHTLDTDPTQKQEQKKIRSKEIKKYNSDFLTFYNSYPIKKSKDKAHESWQKRNPNLEVCLAAIENQKKEKARLKAAGEFCPSWKHPSTWLNQGCWEDECVLTEEDNARERFLRLVKDSK